MDFIAEKRIRLIKLFGKYIINIQPKILIIQDKCIKMKNFSSSNNQIFKTFHKLYHFQRIQIF